MIKKDASGIFLRFGDIEHRSLSLIFTTYHDLHPRRVAPPWNDHWTVNTNYVISIFFHSICKLTTTYY